MPGAPSVVFAVVLLLSLAAPVVLYALVRAERGQREVMDREDAERAARRDTDDRERY